MNRKLLLGVASLLAVAAFAVMPVMAEAQVETQELVSSEANSLCVNPPALKPEIKHKINYLPITTPHKGKFPDTGKSCEAGSATHPTAMNTPGGPGGKAAPYNGAIPGASWVSINPSGSDSANPPPKYYIYDATFTIPCESQVAASEIRVKMFADNTAGAFLNGVPIGNLGLNAGQQNFDQESTTPHGPIGGWPFGPNVGVAGGFQPGLNTIQFVVLDESPGETGLDFSATVTSPECQPHWYSNGTLLAEGEREPVETSGSVTTQAGEVVTKCKLKDEELIENPKGGGAGTDEFTEFTLSGCVAKPSPCPGKAKEEVVALGLPWLTHLIAGPPVRDVIEGVTLEVRCAGAVLDTFSGELAPSVGSSVLEFGNGSGELQDPAGLKSSFVSKDKLKGPKGDEKITAH